MVNIKLSAFSDEYAAPFEEQLIGMKSYGIDFIELRHADKRNVSVLEKDEVGGAKKVLTAAALTYVAALITTLAYLFRFILLARGRNRE